MENGVKNLKGARLFPKTFSNHGFGDASNINPIPLHPCLSLPRIFGMVALKAFLRMEL